MARLAMIVKNDRKRVKAKAKFKLRRELREQSVNMKLTEDQRQEARTKLNKLPKNTAMERVRNRCKLTGRPRGHIGKFGLSRLALRDLANRGLIPGVTKASW